MTQPILNFIGGRWVEPSTEDEYVSENVARPSETVARGRESSETDVRAAAEAARSAFPEWSAMPAPVRGDILYRAAELMSQRVEQFARLTVEEVGKPIAEARAEAQRAVAILRYYGGEGWRALGEVIPSTDARSLLLFTERRPLGVVGVITPWNFPIAIPLWKTAPALVFGNTVVLKPATRGGLVAAAIARLLADAGLPEGVFNVVTGSGGRVGTMLVDLPEVAAITFTGSTRVGMDIARRCAASNKKYQLEMGGKNAQVVLADADLEAAAHAALVGAVGYAGQKCTACSRVIVERSIVDEFVDALRQLAPQFEPKDPRDEASVAGPLISDQHRNWAWGQVQTALAEGARLVYGEAPASEREGYYLSPVIIDQVRIDQAIAQEELFAPILSVVAVEDFDGAIRAANSVRYGLSASVFTRNLDLAFQAARSLEAGLVRVNSRTTGVEPQAPFGGLKLSSSHSREQGRAALEFFTHTQTITIQQGGLPS